MGGALPWAQFAACLVLIGVAGSRLSRYGDIIADKTGLGGNWIGLVLLAVVTSLPELATGVTAVTLAQAPNIALGDALGSCVFNLLILVVLDFLHRGESVYRRASQGHLLSAGFGVVLIGLAGFNLLLGARGEAWAIGHVGIYSPIIAVAYFLAMRAIFTYQQQELAAYTKAAEERYPGITLRQAVRGYAVAGLVVVAAGIWLPFVGNALAQQMGWHRTFVGTLLVAFATSLPELVVTLAALRIGALDMAIGNLLGSNLFDILIIAVDDLFFVKGPLLAHASPLHAASAFSAMTMTGIFIVGLLYRAQGRLLRSVGWTSLFLLSSYLLNAYIVFIFGE